VTVVAASERTPPVGDVQPAPDSTPTVRGGGLSDLAAELAKAYPDTRDLSRLLGAACGTAGSSVSSQIHDLRLQLGDLTCKLLAEKTSRRVLGQRETELREKLRQLEAKQALKFVLDRIGADAGEVLLQSDSLCARFLSDASCHAFVLAIDLRRSTDLMLKSRSPGLFASFIVELCMLLQNAVLENEGVFDKFTGDGILAFFPTFFSGPDAGYRTLAAADSCHQAFSSLYTRSRSAFTCVSREVGLGIGIDYGETHLARTPGSLTIVGTPVVYACRMSQAGAGTTLLNQPAYEEMSSRFGAYCILQEDTIEVKHEGLHIAYAAHLNGRPYTPVEPGWRQFVGSPEPSQDV
jgi:class 3 adenylate cyclase